MQVRNLGAPVELAGRYFTEGADEVTFLNITGFRDFPLGDLPMLEVPPLAAPAHIICPYEHYLLQAVGMPGLLI